MTDTSIKYTLALDTNAFARSLSSTLDGVKGQFAAVSTNAAQSFGGLNSVFSSMQSRLVGLSAVLGTGGFVAGIKSAIDMQDEMSKAAQKVGVSTQAFSELAYAGKLADLSVEDIGKTMAKLSGVLTDGQQGQEKAVELFKRLRLDPKAMTDADQFLMALADRFGSMEDGAKKTSMAIDVFGEKLGPRLLPFLNQGRAGIEQLRTEAAKLGITVSDEAGKRAEEFNDNLTRLTTASMGAANSIGQELVPALTDAAEYFVKAAKETGLWQGALITIGAGFARVLGTDDKGQLESKMSSLRDEVQRLQNTLIGVDAVLQREPGNEMAQRRFANLTGRIKALNTEILVTSAELARLGSKTGDAGAGRGSVNPAGAVKKVPFVPGEKPDSAAPKRADDGPKSFMQYYEAVLDGERQLATERDAIHGMSRAQEMAFWEGIRSAAQLTEQDKLAVSHKIAAARMAMLKDQAESEERIAKEQTDTLARLDDVALAQWEAKELARAALIEQGARNELAAGEISQGQMLAAEELFEQRRLQIRLAALDARRGQLDPDKDVVAIAQINAEIEQAEQQHQLRLAQIRGQIAGESSRQMEQIWSDLGQRMSGLWDAGVNAMMNGTLTWRNAMKAVGAEMVGWFSGIVKRQVTDWWAGEQAKTGATAAGTAQRWVMESWAAAKSVALWAATAVKNIMVSAWEAMAAAWKAVAGIPYVGPVLAVAAAGAAFAGVSALARNVSSAEGGFDIPAGVNPLTQLHEREMVLPASQADVIRRLATSSGKLPGGEDDEAGDSRPSGRGASAMRPITIEVHNNISALDGASVKRVLMGNPTALAEAIKRAVRDAHDL